MNKKEKLKEIIKNSEYKFLGIIKILDYPYLKFQCLECNHIFIVDIPTVLENEEIYCSECYEDIYPKIKNKYEWIRYFYDINGENLTPLEWIENSRSEIKTKCNKCGHVWNRRARSVSGCPKCKDLDRRLSAEDIVKKVKEINPSIKILSDLRDNKNDEPLYRKRINVKCLECGHEYSILVSNLLSGTQCPNCCRKITDNKFKTQVNSYGKITVLGNYVDMKTKILVKCNFCGKEWEINPRSAYYEKAGCFECSVLQNLTADKNEVAERIRVATNDNIEMIGEYKNSYTETIFKCKICGEEFYSQPKYMYGINADCVNRCILYKDISKRYKEIINEKYSEEFEIEYLENRFNYSGKVKLTCKSCGYSEIYSASRLANYNIKCSCCFKGSIEEKELFNFIAEIYSIDRLECNRYFSYKGIVKELDIFIPELRLGIEFDGLYWHSEEVVGKNRQIEKLEFFKDNYNIKVIFVREDEWVYKKEIVKSRIKNIINKISEKYYARQCDIVEITKNQSDLFLNKYHIQGKDSNSIRIGLVQGNKLLSVMTFGKTRNSMRSKVDEKEDTYELLRFASRTDINVIGGFSKLFKYFIKMYNPKIVKTFADRRWSSGNVYEKNGFILDHISEPGYVYFKGLETYHRVQFQKHKLETVLEQYNPNLSEYQNMLNNGYHRYWDCGQLVYYYENKEYKGDK